MRWMQAPRRSDIRSGPANNYTILGAHRLVGEQRTARRCVQTGTSVQSLIGDAVRVGSYGPT